MAFQAVPQGVEVVLKMTQNGVPLVNVWNIDVGHTVTPTDLTDVLFIFQGWLTAQLSTVQSNSILYNEFVATDISVFSGAQVTQPCTTTQGAVSGSQAAGNAAQVVSWRTGFSGRSFRGRTYLGGLTSADLLDAQHVTAAHTAGIVSVMQNLLTLLNTSSFALSVLSRYTAGVLRAVGILTEITSFIIDTVVDSQRRRTAN